MEKERKTDQPFSIDRLPPIVHRAIQELYNVHGLTWQEIEDLSGEKFGQRWDDEVEEDEDREGNVTVTTTTPQFAVHPGRGFVPWDNLPRNVLELFPKLYLPRSNLHRWYKARVVAVRRQMLVASERARTIAESFAKATVEGSNEAVLNAARDQLMVVLSEDGTSNGRRATAKALTGLAIVMQAARANDIKERKVAVEEQVLQMKLDVMKQKAGELVKAIEGAEGAPPASREEMLLKAKDIYGVA